MPFISAARRSAVLLAAAGLACTAVLAQTPTLRLRATIEKVDATSITIKERSGEVITLVRPPDMAVAEVFAITLADIKPGSFIGVGAMPQPDGTQRALQVVVFPEESRGAGEGHRAWDAQPGSTMTNATVQGVATTPVNVPGGQQFTLRYKDGEKTIVVPPGVPVVSFRQAKADEGVLIVPGARVIVTAQEKGGKPTALRIQAGRNGFAPPM